MYTEETLKDLRNAIEQEGSLYLLFLKHVQNIEFYVKRRGSVDPVRIWRARGTRSLERPQTLPNFFTALQEREDSFVRYLLEIDSESTSERTMKKDRRRQSFLIGQHAKFEGRLGNVGDAIKCFPLVGAALPLTEEGSHDPLVFCSLPLPNNVRSGLGVHVNGCFAINDERSSLRTRTRDSTSNDTNIWWNEELIGGLLPSLLIRMIRHARKVECFHMSFNNVYLCV